MKLQSDSISNADNFTKENITHCELFAITKLSPYPASK